MKRRFLILLVILIAVVSLVAFAVSGRAAKSRIVRLIEESAEQRLAFIIVGFMASSAEVDLYAWVDFEHELLMVSRGNYTIFQYGTARIDPASTKIRRWERVVEGYRFVFLVDFGAKVEDTYAPVKATIYTVGAVYAALFALFGWIFISMVADPVTQMAQTVEAITSRNLKARLPVPPDADEVQRLVLTFNALLDDIAATYGRQTRLVEDLTHDLATPVQIMDGYRQLIERHGAQEHLVREFLETSQVQLARLKDMTGLLRDSLAAERARRVEKADASAISLQNLRYYQGLHPEIRFEGRIEAGVSLAIAPEDFERIEHILLDNAVKYGASGGRIELELSVNILRIRDYGVGIAPEERQAVFERYHRSRGTAAMQPGTGLGLAILRRFSEEYGFGIGLESEAGAGCCFTLHFRNPPGPG